MLPEFISESQLLAGGWVIAAILALSTVMWVLIADRYWFMARAIGPLTESTLAHWQQEHSRQRAVNQRLRASLINGFQQRLSNSIGTIQVITAILPLLGLLGTVSGMIKTFEVMTVFGTGNVRGMADGISQALLTTMGGLLTALSGMYFASNLSARVDTETEKLSQRLCLDDETQRTASARPRRTRP